MNEVVDRPLRVFSDGTESYVAYDLEDVLKAYLELVGEHRDLDADEFYEVDDEREMVMHFEDEPDELLPVGAVVDHKGDGSYWIVKAKASAWAVWNGRGFLCTTED